MWWCRSVTIIIDSHACTPNHQAPPAMHRIACHVVGAQGREIPWAQPQQLQAIPAGPSKHTDIWHYDSGQPIPGTPHLAALPPLLYLFLTTCKGATRPLPVAVPGVWPARRRLRRCRPQLASPGQRAAWGC